MGTRTVVNEPEPLNPVEQNDLLLEITLLLTHTLPEGWEEATVAYRALGSHSEMLAQYRRVGRRLPSPYAPPPEVAELFERLRAGMYRSGQGTWNTATFRLTYPSSYDVDYDREGEPKWVSAPPDTARDEELRKYPRDARFLPEWLGGEAGAEVGAMPIAKPYEGSEPDGTPILAQRPDVPAEERDALVNYLEKAPILLAARSFSEDMMDPQRAPSVPMTYHTDGTWIWPGAVAYYLRAHGVAPDPELVAHVRDNGFELPDLPEPVLSAALKYLYSTFER
ncbi:hypothetical protein [Spirillospora sp. NPDC029432]|uniref:hypothetical protein n=1 Tax=Spirillospora sp. NPDC029432 TaxID=3154599 RepID=UPI003455F8C5